PSRSLATARPVLSRISGLRQSTRYASSRPAHSDRKRSGGNGRPPRRPLGTGLLAGAAAVGCWRGRHPVRLRRLAAFATLGFVTGCGNSGNSSGGSNVLPVTVGAGPANVAPAQAFASVTVCAPGTTNCQTIDGVEVDTGSTGLRILASALTLALPGQTDSSGN